jgi:glutathione peroxidase-family protein
VTKKNYAAFAEWCDKFPDQLHILALPSDEFGGQELPTADAVKDFVTKFGFPRQNFTLLERSTMNGKWMNPIYALGKEKFPGDTQWNFSDKFVFDTDGSVIARTSDISDTLSSFEPLLGPKASI